MRAIIKGTEPHQLTQYRAQPGATYDGPNFTPVKDKIRDALLAEQGHLCAYCMQRIPNDPLKMKIEHWHCQANYPNEQLDYKNLLACCLGNEGQPFSDQHCDTQRGDRDISVHPANPSHRQRMQIRYLGDGTIQSDNPQFDGEINTILNLNWVRLKENRKAVWMAITEGLSHRSRSRTKQEIQDLISKWNSKKKGKLREYYDVAIYYLEKKLKSMG